MNFTLPVQQPPPTPPKSSRWDNLKFVLQLAFSSLVGAGATILYGLWAAQVPTIHYSLDSHPIFSAKGAGPNFKATITVSEDDKSFQFSNLSIVGLRVKNNTRHDYSTFTYGVTLPKGAEIIRSESTTKDRAHTSTANELAIPEKPLATMDFTVDPFNRGDEYTTILYIHSPDKPVAANEVELVTKESVKWKYLGDPNEGAPTTNVYTALAIATGVATGLAFSLLFVSKWRLKRLSADAIAQVEKTSQDYLDVLKKESRAHIELIQAEAKEYEAQLAKLRASALETMPDKHDCELRHRVQEAIKGSGERGAAETGGEGQKPS